MSELHRFLFDGQPVRGVLVRLTDSWREVLARRKDGDAFDAPVRHLLGEMAAAGVLMQANIKFNGTLILQIFGDGPVKVAVSEVSSDLGFRTTAKVVGETAASDTGILPLGEMVNRHGQGRCAVTLDPEDRMPGQQPYQGVVPLNGDDGEPLSRLADVLEHYMAKSEQLETKLVLAANDEIAAGLLIQRLPLEGEANLAGEGQRDQAEADEDYNRIAVLAASLKRDELLNLDADTILHRLFWEEKLIRFEPHQGAVGPKFECTCSRERVSNMLRGLGREEIDDIMAEQGRIDVGCDFCGARYQFDAVDVNELFAEGPDHPPGSSNLQ
ncbi:MAG: Hsp33 family molecular chaperone HslO [Burkholderiales bacterium]|nr:Hsp33 family molecular chaperone HslO [Burkholderiales bacterium]